ncbi:hypothetical protein F4803DRAFT_572566 [Xylaria telfairii]|nr:hypothetical protein F4803DRAFT_572566 [Xylaria telfairii]
MADHLEYNLKTFHISSQTFNLSLSMTSVAFIYDVPFQNITQEELSSLIQSKQLWLLPRGLCRLDVHMQLGECDIGRDKRVSFLEFIADAICQSFLWSRLGLSVQVIDVQYHQEENNIPNLYFSIEQADMSSALLSPPHAHTAQIKGLECILRFESSNRITVGPKQEEQVLSQLSISSPMEASAENYTFYTSAELDIWGNAAHLVEAALCITFGTRKRMHGLKIIELGKAPSLLDLAPAIWNSHYLRSTLNHTKNFAVISNILASSLKGQSPELRRKGAGLLISSTAEDNNNPRRGLEQRTKQLESSIQKKLWGLLQDTLDPTSGTTKKIPNSTSSIVDLDHQEYDTDGTMIDEGIANQRDSLDELRFQSGNLPHISPLGYDDYGSSTRYNSNIGFGRQHVYDLTLRSQDHQIPWASEFRGEIGGLRYDADIFDNRLLEAESPYPEPDLSHNMQDHAMSDCIYDENDDIYSHKYDYTNYVG